MNDLWSYLKHPIYKSGVKPKIIDFVYLLLIYLASIIPIALVSYIICNLFDITHNEIELSVPQIILIGMILAPVYEEILFRSLLRFTRNNVLLFIVNLIVLISICIFKSNILPAIILSVIFLSIIYLLIKYPISKIDLFVSSNFNYFFYASSLSFGLVHTFNFTGNIYLIAAFALILAGPQIVLGHILGYVRMNYGLRYSILFHMIVNSSLLLSVLHKSLIP